MLMEKLLQRHLSKRHFQCKRLMKNAKLYRRDYSDSTDVFCCKSERKRLYEYARAGEEGRTSCQRKQRFIISDVFQNQFIMVKRRHNRGKFEVSCSKGTYVRTLSVDFGKALGVEAHMSQLTRVKVVLPILTIALP